MSVIKALIHLKNAQIAFLLETKIQYTILNLNLTENLLKQQLIRGYKIMENKYIIIYLTYFENKPVIKEILIISRPGHRIYIKKSMQKTNNNTLFSLFSTSKGLELLNGYKNMSGELLAYIYI